LICINVRWQEPPMYCRPKYVSGRTRHDVAPGREDRVAKPLFHRAYPVDRDGAKSAAACCCLTKCGEYDYIINGKMIGGFALVGYPAEYGNSGVMTFLVNHDGTVFEKDLGLDTAKIAERISAFNPDKTWQKVGYTEP
jgi:DUF2950 family protein